jgi:hypothetical protein
MSSGLHDPPLGEPDTRSKFIHPAIHSRGWAAALFLTITINPDALHV